MNFDKGDKLFYPDKETAPEIVACLIHSRIPSAENYKSEEFEGFAAVTYGLCNMCIKKLRTDPSYRVHIKRRINERLKNLKPEGET